MIPGEADTFTRSKVLNSQIRGNDSIVLVTAGIVLLISSLPDILWQELIGNAPDWLLWAKLALIVMLMLSSVVWKAIRPLRGFLVIVLVLYLAERVSSTIGATPQWSSWFGATPFAVNMFGIQLLR